MPRQTRHPSHRSSRRELERDARGLVVASLFWNFLVVHTVCVAKRMSVTLSLKSISERQDIHGLPLPQQLAQGMPQRLEAQGTKVPERRRNRHELIRCAT